MFTRLRHHKKRSYHNAAWGWGAVFVVGSSSLTIVGISIFTRQERDRRIQQQLQVADFSATEWGRFQHTMIRTGLMGTSLPGAKSVKEELHVIRSWHQQHGYKGGIVLRELTKPLFRLYEMTSDDVKAEQGAQDTSPFTAYDPMRLARRECYYLYYELHDDGKLQQEVYCRGTTLSADILTCLQFWWTHDDELDCLLHNGFLQHANRMLDDIIPLLNPNATITLSGHSLGGAVAMICAMKLRKRGFHVTTVRAVASPRFCHASSAARLALLLPPDTLRFEQEQDIVPMLPPFGTHVGPKIWFLEHGPPRHVPAANDEMAWTDSIFMNWRLRSPSIVGQSHRIRSFVAYIDRVLDGISKKD